MKKILLVMVVMFLLVFAGCTKGTSKTSNLTVKVVDQDNAVVSSATAKLDGQSGTTDASGKYVFKSLNEGSYSIDVSKEEYQSNTNSVNITGGKDSEITITIARLSSEEISELKELSTIKSYAFTFVIKDKDGKKTTTILEEINDFGKKEHLVVIDEEGEVETEYYLVNNKAKIRSGDEWMELTGEEASNMGGIFSSMAETFNSSARGWYNEAVRVPGASATFKRLGTETANGYPTTKYEYTITGEKYVGLDYQKIVATYWVINSGSYKDYTTRLVMEYTPSQNSTAPYQMLEFNFTSFGEDIKIELPQ